MTSIQLAPVELISSQRTAPQNGAPSSQDYNDSQRELLSDLYSLSGFLNNTLLPILQTLGASAATSGLDGNAVLADMTSSNASFVDASGNALTVADVLHQVVDQMNTVSRSVADQNAQLVQMRTRLATTYQNDLQLAVQNLSSTVANIQNSFAALSSTVATTASAQATQQSATVTSNPIPPGQYLAIPVTLASPYTSTAYVALPVLESAGGFLEITDVTKTSGAVVTVTVLNRDTVNSHIATVSLMARSL